MNEDDLKKFKEDPEYRKNKIGFNALLFVGASIFLVGFFSLLLIKGEISFLQIAGVCVASIVFLSIVTHTSPLYWLKQFVNMYKLGLTHFLSLIRKPN